MISDFSCVFSSVAFIASDADAAVTVTIAVVVTVIGMLLPFVFILSFAALARMLCSKVVSCLHNALWVRFIIQ